MAKPPTEGREEKKPDPRRELGQAAERAAACWLRGRGYEILQRNYRCRAGEIDLIARQGGELVFIEVRSRSRTDFGLPEETVGREKQRRLRRLAAWYLNEPRQPEAPCRFDVVGVLQEKKEPAVAWRFHLYQDAF